MAVDAHVEAYLALARSINRHLNDIGSSDGGAKMGAGSTSTLSRLLVETDLELAEAEGQVKALEVELRDMDVPDKKKYREKVSQFRNDLSTLRRSFDTAKARAEKRMLLQPGGSGGTKVNSHTERLMRSTEQLYSSRRVVNETEYIGDGIIHQMESQREQLLRASEQVQETNWFTRSARQVMNSMHLRAIRHKACLILIIVFLLILIAIVFNYGVLERYRKKK